MDHWLSSVFIDLVTPFHHGAVDGAALASLVRWQAGRGIRGFVVGGAAGECASLAADERRAVAAIIRANAGRYARLIVLVGTYDTAATVREIEQSVGLSADAILLRTPYYSRPTQEGLVAHIMAAAGGSPMPIILDDDPDRCGIQISLGALETLAAQNQIVGLLDRRGDARRCEAIGRALPGRYALLSGRIDSFACYRLCGGSGVVSSPAALFPGLCVRLIETLRQEDYPTAQMLQRRMHEVLALLDADIGPARLKAALALLRPGSLALDCRESAGPLDVAWVERMHEALGRLPREGATVRSTALGQSLDRRLSGSAERQAALQARM